MKSGIGAFGRVASVRAISAVLLAVAGPMLAASAGAAAEREIGAVVLPEYRDAMARPDGASQLHAIRYRDKVFALDTVATGANGATSLQFLDATRIDVGPGAEVRLDDFIYDPGSTEGAGEMSFAVGAFRYVGGRMTTEENIRLKTPTATMVIRGTELVIYVWPDGRTEVNVISGAVEISACGGAGGSQLAMTGMQVTVSPDCATQRAPVRAMPAGFAALNLPADDEAGGEEGDEGPGDRGGDGRDRGTTGRGSSGKGGTGGTGGGTQNGGASHM